MSSLRHDKPGRDRLRVPHLRRRGRYIASKVSLERDEAAIAKARKRSGRFILATNVLEKEQFTNDELLEQYKGQQ